MKKIFFILFLLTTGLANAQQYISSGSIEFEVRINNHKVYGDGIWADIIKQRAPQFSTTYYTFTFDDNKALYKFDRYDPQSRVPNITNSNVEDNVWYNDYANKTFVDQKFVFDNTHVMSGARMNIDWKLSPNETREIAGFTCRKATGVIFDSVYVFAFYTDEITISGGPMGINGLPGMILGITIPRMYTSWIATRIQTTGVNTKTIVAPQKGRKSEAMELKKQVEKVAKDWGNWGQQSIWQIFL